MREWHELGDDELLDLLRAARVARPSAAPADLDAAFQKRRAADAVMNGRFDADEAEKLYRAKFPRPPRPPSTRIMHRPS